MAFAVRWQTSSKLCRQGKIISNIRTDFRAWAVQSRTIECAILSVVTFSWSPKPQSEAKLRSTRTPPSICTISHVSTKLQIRKRIAQWLPRIPQQHTKQKKKSFYFAMHHFHNKQRVYSLKSVIFRDEIWNTFYTTLPNIAQQRRTSISSACKCGILLRIARIQKCRY